MLDITSAAHHGKEAGIDIIVWEGCYLKIVDFS